DKTVAEYLVYGLQPSLTYYFRVRTFTPTIGTVQPNDLWSTYSSVVSAATLANSFADVPPPGKEWTQPWVELLYQEGITGGCAQNPLRYCPEDPVTRAQMAAFILRAKHGASYTPPHAAGTFADVPTRGKEWAEPWIERLYGEGITTGCGQNPLRYCPENPVTRGQMAAFILRAKYGSSYTPPPARGIFADVPAGHWSAPWIERLYSEGITTGCGQAPLRYCPDQQVTRGQMAAFILRAEHGASYAPPNASGTFADVPTPGKEWAEPWIE